MNEIFNCDTVMIKLYWNEIYPKFYIIEKILSLFNWNETWKKALFYINLYLWLWLSPKYSWYILSCSSFITILCHAKPLSKNMKLIKQIKSQMEIDWQYIRIPRSDQRQVNIFSEQDRRDSFTNIKQN